MTEELKTALYWNHLYKHRLHQREDGCQKHGCQFYLFYLSIYFIILTWGHFLFPCFQREECREWERETSMWEGNISWLSLIPAQTGTEPPTAVCALLRDRDCNFSITGRRSNHLNNPGWSQQTWILEEEVPVAVERVGEGKGMGRITLTYLRLNLFLPNVDMKTSKRHQLDF